MRQGIPRFAAVAGAALTISHATIALADPFRLTSTTFDDGALMPKKVSNNLSSNPNCIGENLSPQLAWTGAPDSAKSFALTMVDPEGRAGLGVYHWVAYGIAPTVTSLAEGEASKPSDKYIGGKSTQGVGTYSGPCPPQGALHHYTFVVTATDLDPSDLPPGLTLPELWSKLAGHAKAAAGLVGIFRNPY